MSDLKKAYMRNQLFKLMDSTDPDGRMESLHIVLQVKIGDFKRRKYKTVMPLRIFALKQGAHAQ